MRKAMKNDDYILREGAIDALTVSALLRNMDSVEDGPAHRYKRAAERIIAGVPAADVERVRHAYWIDIVVIDMPAQACSNCRTFYSMAYTGGGHPYCPNCGAKMDAEPPKEEKDDEV